MSNQVKGWLMGRILDKANGDREGHFRYRQKPGIRESPRNLQLAFCLLLFFQIRVDADTLWSFSCAAAPENKSHHCAGSFYDYRRAVSIWTHRGSLPSIMLLGRNWHPRESPSLGIS